MKTQIERYINAIKKRSKNLKNRFRDAYRILFATKQGPLDKYVLSAPSPENALSIFQDEWSSSFPPPIDKLKFGTVPLFQDSRIEWGIKQLGGVKGKSVLELGPLEGGHSYMLQKQGASSVVAIEASPRAFLKCLVVKQTFQLNHVDFLCGDFMEYLRLTNNTFDLCVASGVLYHMQNPVELIALAAKRCSQLFLWTHYYDPTICSQFLLKPRFQGQSKAEYKGFKHTLNPYRYGSARSWSTFIGGPASTSNWLSREDILACCKYFGFNEIHINFESSDHAHGPSFAFTASK